MDKSKLKLTRSGKVKRDIEFLSQCFREVLEELGEFDVLSRFPGSIPSEEANREDTPIRMAQAYALIFQLMNLVEENASVQYRRMVETEDSMKEVPGLWEQNLDRLKKLNIPEKKIASILSKIQVEPVLTAHPTEAKRATILEHYRKLYLLLVKRENQMWTPHEQIEIRNNIKAELERLWRTGDIFLEKPDVESELNNVIYYLTKVFPDVLPVVDRRIRQGWKNSGFDSELLRKSADLPRLSFGNWVGGDRDGHPLVTSEVTETTLKKLRVNSLKLIHERLTKVIKNLSLSDRYQNPPEALKQRIKITQELLGDEANTAMERNSEEPWRTMANLMLVRLPIRITGQKVELVFDKPWLYKSSAELLEDLKVMHSSLMEVGAKRLAASDVSPLFRLVQTFGFHLAALDIRQNSEFHDRALSQLMSSAGIKDAETFPEWSEEKRVKFLLKELESSRPFTRRETRVGKEALAVMDCYCVLKEHIKKCGIRAIGALIISMTRSFSDLLVVFALVREAGLLVDTDEGLACPFPIVPLFETIDDLKNSPDILEKFLKYPMTNRSLEYQRQQKGADEMTQQIMVGYSDSNKDGGIFASLWNLHRAEENLAEIGIKNRVKLRFFHGRGGTISRGSGPTHRFINALPHSALNGDFRCTEQGETIAQKFANKQNAAYNLELLLAGTTGATLTHWNTPKDNHPLHAAMDKLSEYSLKAYENLIHQDGFIDFFRQATPVDVIEANRIGSRPARRTGKKTIADLRAIPWVFSWSQSRFNLSGWYGAGTAFETLMKEDPATFEKIKQENSKWSPLHYITGNVATSIATADFDIMQQFAQLVEDEELRDRVMKLIISEFERTKKMLELIYGGPLEETRPKIQSKLDLRKDGLTILQQQQIELIKEWRKSKDSSLDANGIFMRLLLMVNAVAGGLRTTG